MNLANLNQRQNSSLGFTIIELMVSIAVMAAGVFTLLELHTGLAQQRKTAQDQNQLISLGRMITDRFVSADFTDLGDATKAPWSVPRFQDTGVLNNTPPLQGAELVALASAAIKVPQAKMYVEYYRGLRADFDLKPNASVGNPALIEQFESELKTKLLAGQITKDVDAGDFFRQKIMDPAVRALYRLNPEKSGVTPLPLFQYQNTAIDEDDLLLIRVVLVIDDHEWSVFTAKRKETGQ